MKGNVFKYNICQNVRRIIFWRAITNWFEYKISVGVSLYRKTDIIANRVILSILNFGTLLLNSRFSAQRNFKMRKVLQFAAI